MNCCCLALSEQITPDGRLHILGDCSFFKYWRGDFTVFGHVTVFGHGPVLDYFLGIAHFDDYPPLTASGVIEVRIGTADAILIVRANWAGDGVDVWVVIALDIYGDSGIWFIYLECVRPVASVDVRIVDGLSAGLSSGIRFSVGVAFAYGIWLFFYLCVPVAFGDLDRDCFEGQSEYDGYDDDGR